MDHLKEFVQETCVSGHYSPRDIHILERYFCEQSHQKLTNITGWTFLIHNHMHIQAYDNLPFTINYLTVARRHFKVYIRIDKNQTVEHVSIESHGKQEGYLFEDY
jgi:hypothetical protein